MRGKKLAVSTVTLGLAIGGLTLGATGCGGSQAKPAAAAEKKCGADGKSCCGAEGEKKCGADGKSCGAHMEKKEGEKSCGADGKSCGGDGKSCG